MQKTKHHNKMQKIALISLVVVSAWACNQKTDSSSETEIASTAQQSEEDLTAGFNVLEGSCFACHSPSADHDNRVAPPMVAIKRHYIDDETTLEEFTQALTAFVTNPTAENSKMPGAQERFGVMPKLAFTEEQLRQAALYIYTNELEKPDWFDTHYQEERKKRGQGGMGMKRPLEHGQAMAMQTKSVLGKNLMGAIKAKGTEAAVDFCSTRAVHLTDSMSQYLGVQIKRVSDKNRNADNHANAAERAYINKTKAAIANGEKPTPQLITNSEGYTGYYPITTNQMCLQCHGQPGTDVTPAVQAKIAELYPNDAATGYGVDELRGIWVVEMANQTDK